MIREIGTKYKFRHYSLAEDGNRYLVWASDEFKSEFFKPGEVLKGSFRDLEIMRSQLWTPNALADEGEIDILDVYVEDQAVRASTFFRLYNDTPAETDTLATLVNEVSGTGYGGITVTRGTDWSAPALDSGDGMSTSVVKTFTAGGTWTAATQLVWASVASGTSGLFLGWVALSATRTLVNTDTLDVTLGVKLA
jgi:hypothetical protein